MAFRFQPPIQTFRFVPFPRTATKIPGRRLIVCDEESILSISIAAYPHHSQTNPIPTIISISIAIAILLGVAPVTAILYAGVVLPRSSHTFPPNARRSPFLGQACTVSLYLYRRPSWHRSEPLPLVNIFTRSAPTA